VNQVVDLGIVTGQATTPARLTADQQTILYEQSINYFQAFPGRGLRLWGARTLSQNPTWQQVNVRRLFITVGRWLERLMAELPFTSNDTQLWMRIVRQVTAYLDDLFRQGALKGQTAEQAFFVKCDAETNPPELYKTGVVITQIGLAAAVPAEFIEARVIQSITGVTIQT
jgi:phage tail sheath protein FI